MVDSSSKIRRPDGSLYDPPNWSPGQFPMHISAGALTDIAKCPALFFESRVMGTGVSKNEDSASIHAHAGKVFAATMEHWRLLSYGTESYTPTEIRESTQEHFKGLWGDTEPPPGIYKNKENTWKAIHAAITRWSAEDDWLEPVIGEVDGELQCEATFAVPLGIKHPDHPEHELHYVGILDMLARARTSNALWVEDDKTTSRMGTSWHTAHQMHTAAQGYCWAMHAYGKDVVGYVIRGHQIAKTVHQVDEVSEPVPLWRRERWETRMHTLVEKALSYHRMQQWPEFGIEAGICGFQYGRVCPYVPICYAHDTDAARDTYFGSLQEESKSPFDALNVLTSAE